VVDHVPRKITSRDHDLLQDMADVVVSEMEVRRRVGTDALTGLYTRRFVDELGMREIIRARRDGESLTAAFIDADRFKVINDTYGHPAGDAALRATDILGRYGGEELVLLLPQLNLEQAMPVLERVRQDVEAMVIPELKGRPVTVSIGAAELDENDLTITDLLGRADRVLSRAKQSGRNRIERALAA